MSPSAQALTLDNKTVSFVLNGGNVYVNGATVLTADVQARGFLSIQLRCLPTNCVPLPSLQAQNGVVHIIDTVLVPFSDLPTIVSQNSQLTVLTKLLSVNGLIPTLSG